MSHHESLDIHRATSQEDLNACFSIRMKVFVEEQQVPPDEELDEYDDSWEACCHFLAQIGGEPAATARYRPYSAEQPLTAKLQRIAVLREHRGTGLGRRLVLAMEAHAKEAGATAAVLDAQCQAEPFYQKLGYETLSKEPFLDAGIPHVRMRKEL
ncbi:GNAT family N-acetyltransferase [Gorillibacterium sp. CAU 1737]|uniref:GNAT family N-acetyltransferase n=1 Tax=Gorillibacterium sp. CAU 1737 TaxID=3140362 RepID=UPI00326067D9